MVQKISDPKRISGTGRKITDEYVGLFHTNTSTMSVARTIASPEWASPFQKPEYDEVTIVVRGNLRVESSDDKIDVGPNETVLCSKGELVRYCNPFFEEAEYWSICVPAFSEETANLKE